MLYMWLNVPNTHFLNLMLTLWPGLFVFLCVCLRLTETDRRTEEGGVSINTMSMEAQGLSDPPVNFQGGCRGHRRGQSSAFMLITNNTLLCSQHREKTSCSYKPECNYAKYAFMIFVFQPFVFIDFSLSFCFFLLKKHIYSLFSWYVSYRSWNRCFIVSVCST